MTSRERERERVNADDVKKTATRRKTEDVRTVVFGLVCRRCNSRLLLKMLHIVLVLQKPRDIARKTAHKPRNLRWYIPDRVVAMRGRWSEQEVRCNERERGLFHYSNLARSIVFLR